MIPIEIIALVLIIVTVIKLLVILTNPKKWGGVIEAIWKNNGLVTVVSLVLAGVVLYYLLGAGITIIQIFAVMAFLCLLMALSISAYSKDLIGFAKKIFKDKAVVKKAWLVIIIWIILILWGLKELFITA